ncbi:MAG TPA: trypsin-like peptidase domain-containing protein [Trebonia sp.]|jgi:S1-C subfamily serine protease|nr:trypsin-like peptidase domain-containing protein [Trebonia sp.]
MSEPFAQYSYGQYPVPEPPRRRGRHALGLTATAVLALAVGAGAGVALTNSDSPAGTTATSESTANPAKIASKIDPGLVDIAASVAYQNATDFGTGIVLTSNGEVLTNNHVINGASSISVTDIGTGKTYKATVVGYDESKDVAVLQLSGASGLTTAPIGDSSTVKVGQSVVGIGNAGGAGGTPSVAAGTVTALGQSIPATDESTGTTEHLTGMIETNADIQPGDSGGPLVNANGQVIGMDTAASSGYQFGSPDGGGSTGNGSSGSGQESQTQGFSIPINTALSVAREIEAGQASSTVHIGETAFLGIAVAPSSYQTSAGVTIEGAEPGTPAYSAGLSEDDVITSVAGHQVSSDADIQQVLEGYHPGDKISIAWTNANGGSQNATVTLANGPAA